MMIGLHEDVYQIEALPGEIETIIVRFSPWGFRQFADMSVSALTNKVYDAAFIFGKDIYTLYETMSDAGDFGERINLLDSYFEKKLKTPDPGYAAVAEIAEKIRNAPEPVSFEMLGKESALPLGPRQMARRFKDIIGVNLRTFIRMCRFETAKSAFFQKQGLSLTDIGYLSGYYDQAHFSKEFKKLSGLNAKNFFPRCALQKMLHEKA